MCRKLSWWNLRRGAKLRGPKTYHQDWNHATSKAKAAETKDKTETMCGGDAFTRRTGVMRAPERPTTRTTATPHHPPFRLCLCCVCVMPCSVVFTVRCAIQSTAAYDVICSFLPDRR